MSTCGVYKPKEVDEFFSHIKSQVPNCGMCENYDYYPSKCKIENQWKGSYEESKMPDIFTGRIDPTVVHVCNAPG